jgi:hypothetical protein
MKRERMKGRMGVRSANRGGGTAEGRDALHLSSTSTDEGQSTVWTRPVQVTLRALAAVGWEWVRVSWRRSSPCAELLSKGSRRIAREGQQRGKGWWSRRSTRACVC